MNKQEVDALQIAAAKEQKPWYRHVPTMISLMALLFSFGTTFVTYVRTGEQDIQNLRSDLRAMLQRMALLPKENFELTRRYANDLLGVAFLSGYISQENSLLAQQAADIVNKLPQNRVSGTELHAIAIALQASYANEEALNLLRRAGTLPSNDLNTQLAILRAYANLLFLTGQPEAGRVEYQRALGIFSHFRGYNEFTVKFSHIWTELGWAMSEASVGAMALAQQHVANAESHLSTMMAGPATEQVRRQIEQTRAQLAIAATAGPLPGGPPAPPGMSERR